MSLLDREEVLQRISDIIGVPMSPGLPQSLSRTQLIALWVCLSKSQPEIEWFDRPMSHFRELIIKFIGMPMSDSSQPITLPSLRVALSILEENNEH